IFFFSSRRRHTRSDRDWSSDVCSSDLIRTCGIDQYRMCEWGIMKRAVEANTQGLRGRKIVALGASMSKFAIVVARGSKYYEPERSEERRVGKECRERWSPEQLNKERQE